MKKITIINGLIDESHQNFEQDLDYIFERYKDNIEFESFNIRDMNIKFCCGCFGCWVKTPGKCIQNDEMPKILQSIINSDLTVFLSPVQMGFVSANIKKVCDKLIPLVHPYIDIFFGECHHMKRYDTYPKLGLVLIDEEQTNKECHDIISDVYQRMAINLKTELVFSIMTHGSLEEVEHAINHF